MARKKSAANDNLNLDLTPKKVRQSRNGENKRYSLKVLPQAAKLTLEGWNNGEVDVSMEEEATKRLKDLLDANGGVTEIAKRGIRISLYHYRMPLQVVGAEKPLTSKEFRAGTPAAEVADPDATVSSIVEDELLALAEELRIATEEGNEERREELMANMSQLATQI
jgi:hypothetical protein